MFRKGIVLVVMLLFVGMTIAPTSGIDLGKQSTGVTLGRDILYVGGTGSGNYSTIQEAIDDANNGDTVFVYDDSSPYYENFSIYKSINLIGEDKNTTIINGNQSISVISIYSENVKIKSFTISNLNKSGINTFANNVTIDGNIFINIKRAIVAQNDYHIITNNMISASLHGIELFWSNESFVNNNIVSNAVRGIFLFFANRNNISENIIKNNSVGIMVWSFDSRENEIINNNFELNNIHSSFLSKNYFREKPNTNWRGNYWGQTRILPWPIYGDIVIFFNILRIRWVEIDWTPASEPYTIEV